MTDQRNSMIDGQLRPNKVNDETILAAMEQLPRDRFVPELMRGVAYVDEDIRLSANRCLMEPMVFSRLMQAASPSGADTALIIASNSGFSACVLATVCASVVGVEEDKALLKVAQDVSQDLELSNASFVASQANDLSKVEGPFSLVFVEGGVADKQALLDLIGPKVSNDARLVFVHRDNPKIPGVAMRMRRIHGTWSSEVLFDASVPLLPEFMITETFEF